MPTFNKQKRYKTKKGQLFGNGVWYNDAGKMIMPGQGVYDSKTKTVRQYNTDGSVSTFSRQDWAKKQMQDTQVRILQNDRKYAIPVIPEKMMTVSIDNGGKKNNLRGMTFSANMLDSIAVNAHKAGLPFETALGIVAKESMGGMGKRRPGVSLLSQMDLIRQSSYPYLEQLKGISYEGVQSPTLLTSDWKQYTENPYSSYFYDGPNPLKESRDESYYDTDFYPYTFNKGSKFRIEDASPLYHSFKRFKEDPNTWNPREPGYKAKAEKYGKELTTQSPEIRDYMQKKNIHSNGGILKQEPTWDTLPMREKSAYIKTAVQNGMTRLQDIRQAYNEFRKGGFMPSKGMQQRIADWEGDAMTKSTIDPLSGKRVRKNRSFEEASKGFVNAMPTGVREQVLANPELADWLYSYSYNVGAGRFKERVVPALQRYYNGNGSVEDIQNSMWASGDKRLRGLANRRARERQGVQDALWDTEMQRLNAQIENPTLITTPTYDFTPLNEELVANAGIQDYSTLIVTTPTPTEQVVQETPVEAVQEPSPWEKMLAVQNMMNTPVQEDTPAFMPKVDYSAPFVARTFGEGGDTEDNTPWVIDMTNVGLGAEKKPNYYVDRREPLEEVVITGKRPNYNINPKYYSSAFDGSVAGNMEVLNAMTGGLGNRLSATQNLRLLYDVAKGNDWRQSWMGNNGLVSNNFAQEHPYYSMLINGAGDIAGGLGSYKAISGVGKGLGTAYDAGKQALQTAYDNGTFWDRYTTLGGRFGNWGDTWLDKVWGTTARRFGLPDKARIPGDTMRKLREMPTTSNSMVDFTGHKQWTDKPHINTTTDRFVVAHKSGWDGADGYIFPTQTFLDQTHPTGALKSIEPSDMFANGSRVQIPTGEVTLVSGDVEALKKAQEAGMQTLSSPRLRRLYAREKPTDIFGKDPKGRSFWNEYAREQQRLLTRRGSPTLSDYKLLEQQTGLKAGVSSMDEMQKALTKLRSMVEMQNLPISKLTNVEPIEYTYPNGRVVDDIQRAATEIRNIENTPYNNVFYDPATWAESNWQNTLTK